MRTLDAFFLVGCAVSFLIALTVYQFAMAIQSPAMVHYAVVYMSLSTFAIVLSWVMVALLGYELEWKEPVETWVLSIFAFALLVLAGSAIVAWLLPGAAVRHQAMGVPVVEPIELPAGIAVVGIVELFFRLSDAMRVALNKLVALLLCIPSGYAETCLNVHLGAILDEVPGVPTVLAYTAANACFGLLHYTVYGVGWAIGSFAMGMLLSAIWLHTGSASVVAISHVLYNASVLLLA